MRLLVMVNDFGAINIDAALLASQTDDTLTLSNGCVCCTMGADLFMAVGDVLDRAERPDHLVIEASGIADPARIAQVAQAEPELTYGGIVTVVDAQGYPALVEDPQIGPQVAGQVRVADLICLSKTTGQQAALELKLSIQSGAQVFDLNAVSDLAPVLFGGREATVLRRYMPRTVLTWGGITAMRASLNMPLCCRILQHDPKPCSVLRALSGMMRNHHGKCIALGQP
jgi:G3E family GTPase